MATPAFPGSALSKYNNDPGSGRTGYWEVPPNNYDFYTEEEKYKPNVQADGGILSSARPGDGACDAKLPSGPRGCGCERSSTARGVRCRLANPGFREVASRLVLAVLSSARPRPARLGAHVQPHAGAGGCGPSEGVRNGSAPWCVCSQPASLHAWRSGAQTQATSLLATSTRARPRSSCSCAASWCVLRGTAPFATSYTRALSPVCASAAQHHDEEYGGPFWVEVSPKMKIDELRNVIRDACGIIPGSQRLSFAGKNFEDSGRSLEQCVPELRS